MNILLFIISSIIIWVLGFSLHEICHKIGGMIQGADSYIDIWWHKGIISMRCIYTDSLKYPWLAHISGGFVSGVTLMVLSLLTINYIELFIPLFTVGFINFIYSFYETLYIRKYEAEKYMKWHYWLYLVSGIIGICISLGILWA